MEEIRNLKRQIKDVVSQVDNLKRSQNFESDFKDFTRFVSEMKTYIKDNVDNQMILQRVDSLPKLKYNKTNISILLLPFLPYYGAVVLNNYKKKKNALSQAEEVSSVFSSIDFLLGRN